LPGSPKTAHSGASNWAF